MQSRAVGDSDPVGRILWFHETQVTSHQSRFLSASW
jgi:hypothetical protein